MKSRMSRFMRFIRKVFAGKMLSEKFLLYLTLKAILPEKQNFVK